MDSLNEPKEAPRMLRLPAVKDKTGLCRASIYRAMELSGFPRPVRLGSRAVAWVEAEVNAWLELRIKHARSRPAAAG